MKTLEMIIKTKRNLIAIVRNASIALSMFALLMACDPSTNDESETNQDSTTTVKPVEIQQVDSTVMKDTVKKVDVGVKKQ